MSVKLSSAVRTALAQAIVTAAGAGAKLKGYNGAEPAGLAAVQVANTLLCQVSFGASIGLATAGTIDWDEAGATQAPNTFTAGVPTFFDLTTAADLVVGRIGVQGPLAGEWSWSGTVAPGQPISLTNLVWAMPGGQV